MRSAQDGGGYRRIKANQVRSGLDTTAARRLTSIDGGGKMVRGRTRRTDIQ